MEFKTTIELEKGRFRLSHTDSVLCLGSCFAQSMGGHLQKSGFRCMVNPFGVLYNPISVVNALNNMWNEKPYSDEDLFEYQGLYGSFDFHSTFACRDKEVVLGGIQQSLTSASEVLKTADCLILSLGTAWVYSLASEGRIVSNCHKLPAAYFTRRRLDVDEMLEISSDFFEVLLKAKPDLKILMTVSPIRHFKDGAHENTLSKAALHLLIEQLRQRFSQVLYFPAYELLMDDLRDYRYYDQDMLHPSALAIQYIWERFGEFAFQKHTIEIIRQLEHIHKAMEHKPFRQGDEEYIRFVKKNIASLNVLATRFPELNIEYEKAFFESALRSYAFTD